MGKSSLINGLLGKKVVSASRTPGHTKVRSRSTFGLALSFPRSLAGIGRAHVQHFQTIHLTENVRVTDCPGLVFPSLLPKPLQILAGMYNIAQVNEPYSVVQFLAERVPLPELLDLIHPALLPEWQEDAPTGPVKVRHPAAHLRTACRTETLLTKMASRPFSCPAPFWAAFSPCPFAVERPTAPASPSALDCVGDL